MWKKLNSLVEKKSPIQITIICILLVFFLGLMDFLTGYEFSFSIFYLVPISIASWHTERRYGLSISIMSAIVWGSVDILSGQRYGHIAILFWNTLVRLGFFTITTQLLSTLKVQFKIEKKLAKTDTLTNTLNGRAFKETAKKLLGIADRYNRPVVLGYIDIDNFKKVNDTLGHIEGDKVLKTIGVEILSSIRSADCVGRMGGDEFAILLPETSRLDATFVFERIQKQILKQAKENNWPISLSIGVAVFSESSPTIEEAIKLADNLMYRVKNKGKNGILIEEFLGKKNFGDSAKSSTI